jgi:glycosyltransferase involved in cell wall biosynthesis
VQKKKKNSAQPSPVTDCLNKQRLSLQFLMSEVLLLCEYATLSGGEQSMLATLPGMWAAGINPIVACPAEGILAEALRAEGVEIAPFSTFTSDGQKLSQKQLREELARLIKHRRPGILHANSLSMGRLSGPVAVELGVPSITHLRDVIRLSRQAQADLNCHRSLLAVSKAVRNFLVAGGLDSTKTCVLYNGVDLDLFCPRAPSGFLHAELGLSPQAALAGVIGQIGLRKGQDIFVQAAIEVSKKLAEVHFLIIGERFSEKAESRDFETALHDAVTGTLHGRLHFLGYRRHMELIYPELTLVVHPARQEPLGRVLLEAAAAGRAVIATDVGGTGEIFPPQREAALLVPPNDPEKLATGMMELLNDPDRRHRYQLGARRRAEEDFDIKTAVVRLLEHYQALL